jgi:ribosome-interacting GTPase 1
LRDGVTVSREQVINRLREAGWHFKRRAKRVEIWKKGTQRVDLVTRKALAENYVRALFTQAGLTPAQIEQFLRDCVTG